MRVLLAHNFYRSSAPSGEDAVYRSERALLESNGIEVIPYEIFNDNIDDSTLVARVRVGVNTTWSKKSYRDIHRLIRKTRPDIAHFHNTFPQISPSAYLACQEQAVPVVQTLHNFRFVCPGAMLMRDGHPCELCLDGNLLPSLKHRCYRESTMATTALAMMILYNRMRGNYQNLVNRYISLTRFSASRLIAGGLPKDKIAIKPNFIENISDLDSEKQGYAIYVGRLKSEKGVRTLLKAWHRLPDVPLRIVGDGELRAEMEQEVNTYGLNVEFLGYLPRTEVLAKVKHACMQIVPSECYEGFPLVILEAYASGTPVVASNIGSLSELVEDGRTGEKFEPTNAQDLAEKVKYLWTSPRQYHAMGEYARHFVRSQYTEDQNFRQLMQIYQTAKQDFTASTFFRSTIGKLV